jgi:GNAT superfamily N-acetyltransferase
MRSATVRSVIFEFGAFELDDNRDRVDRDAVWQYLSTEAYWARWRERGDVERQIDGAWRVVAAYEKISGRMVGFSRAISDGVSFAYLADVFVEPSMRGRGVGVELVRFMVERGPARTFRWALHTKDAHSLYERYGFGPPDGSRYLERPGRRPTTAPGRADEVR